MEQQTQQPIQEEIKNKQEEPQDMIEITQEAQLTDNDKMPNQLEAELKRFEEKEKDNSENKKDEPQTQEEIMQEKIEEEIKPTEEIEENQEVPINIDVAEKFEKEFNIKKEDFNQIPNFKNLSKGQQLLVLENFRQVILGDIKKSSAEKYNKSIAEAGRIGKSIKGLGKDFIKTKEYSYGET